LKTIEFLFILFVFFFFSQLIYDGYSTIAISLTDKVNANPPCCPSARLMSLVTKGSQYEIDKQEESDQALDINPIQQLIIRPGIGMLTGLFDLIHLCNHCFT